MINLSHKKAQNFQKKTHLQKESKVNLSPVKHFSQVKSFNQFLFSKSLVLILNWVSESKVILMVFMRLNIYSLQMESKSRNSRQINMKSVLKRHKMFSSYNKMIKFASSKINQFLSCLSIKKKFTKSQLMFLNFKHLSSLKNLNKIRLNILDISKNLVTVFKKFNKDLLMAKRWIMNKLKVKCKVMIIFKLFIRWLKKTFDKYSLMKIIQN